MFEALTDLLGELDHELYVLLTYQVHMPSWCYKGNFPTASSNVHMHDSSQKPSQTFVSHILTFFIIWRFR